MTNLWIQATDWDTVKRSFKPGDEIKTVYSTETIKDYVKQVTDTEILYRSGFYDNRISFDKGLFKVYYKISPKVLETCENIISKIRSIFSTNENYPHKCPKCKGPAYISFLNQVDCLKGCQK